MKMDKDLRTVKQKAFLEIIYLVFIKGLSLFSSAGTLNFREAWVYLFIFGSASLVITLFLMNNDMDLLKRRVNTGAWAEKTRNQKIIQTIAGVLFIVTMVIPGLDHRFGWSDVPLYLIITGDFFQAFGFYIVFLAFRANSYASAVIETAEDQTVVSTGPYAVVRH